MNKFKVWFRGLSTVQALVVYGWLALVTLLIFWHCPFNGYERTLHRVVTPIHEQALSRAADLEARRGAPERYYEGYSGKASKSSYYYMEENPAWWLYGYKSKGFDVESLPMAIRSKMEHLESLGILINYIAGSAVVGWFLIWLTGIRSQSAKPKDLE